MRTPHAGIALLLLAGMLAACDRTPEAPAGASDTSVLGGYGHAPRPAASEPLVDAQGNALPAPPVPRGAKPELARSGPDGAVAVWVQEGNVVAASYRPTQGWGPAQPLESIYGDASDARVAGNGQGVAIAIWRHTVGNIQSMRFSRFDAATGWSTPDVMPGALPRAAEFGGALRLEMDAQGNAYAQWPSGFDANEEQTARYLEGSGWTRALGQATASAAAASAPREP